MTQPATLLEFVWMWNREQGQRTPGLHREMCGWLHTCRRAGRRNLLLAAFRNSGKSTLAGLFAAWLISQNPNIRILVLAADQALAQKMVRNVKRVVERHPLTRGLKPGCADQWAADRFTVNRAKELRDPTMLAKSAQANITGSRADVILYDDVEAPNTSGTPAKREDLRERLRESDYVLVPGGTRLYIGTPHAFETIYAAGPKGFLAGFERLELPLLNSKGESRWPERFSTADIENLRRASGVNKFESQMMLRPVSWAEGRLDPDKLRLYKDELDEHRANGEHVLMLGRRRLVSASCWWDPAYGAPGKGDNSVIACVFTDDGGGYWLHAVEYLHCDPNTPDIAEATQQIAQIMRFAERWRLPSVTVETNGIGRFLPGLLKSEVRARGLGCAVGEHVSKGSKDLRIIDTFDAVLAAGRLNAHARIWDTPFIREMREWRPGVRAADDGLDAVSGCLLSEPVRLSRFSPADSESEAEGAARAQRAGRTAWRRGAGQFTADTNFPV
ncbi:MAG: phage terminase large subunit [Rhodospirillales bacterium]